MFTISMKTLDVRSPIIQLCICYIIPSATMNGFQFTFHLSIILKINTHQLKVFYLFISISTTIACVCSSADEKWNLRMYSREERERVNDNENMSIFVCASTHMCSVVIAFFAGCTEAHTKQYNILILFCLLTYDFNEINCCLSPLLYHFISLAPLISLHLADSCSW